MASLGWDLAFSFIIIGALTGGWGWKERKKPEMLRPPDTAGMIATGLLISLCGLGIAVIKLLINARLFD